jgi:hypothetical protein
MMAVVAVYYGLCLRSRYFIEWWSSADAKEAYYVLAYYNHRYNARAVASHLPLTDCLEFYRLASGRESFDEFVHSDPMPSGKDAYAGFESHDRGLIASEGLKVVYRGRIDSDVVVAIRPDLETGSR